MKKFGWAIVWPGPIAHKFAKVVTGIDAAALVRIQGRGLARAFADQWCPDGSMPGRINLLAIDGIDTVLNNTGGYAIYHLHRDTTRRSR